jgi:hypothetical protein
MRAEQPKVAPEDLYPRRVAVRALGVVLEHFGLAEAAVKLNPDAPENALPGPGDGEVALFADGWERGQRPIARVYVAGEKARVVVDQVRELVRRSHRRDFRAEEVGIRSEPGEPDVDMEVDLSEVLEEFGEKMRTMPQRAAPRPRRPGRFRRYRGALGRR